VVENTIHIEKAFKIYAATLNSNYLNYIPFTIKHF